MNAETEYPRALFAASPLVHELRAALPMLGDRAQGQLHDLHRETTSERCFTAARAASELYTHLMRLGIELDRRG